MPEKTLQHQTATYKISYEKKSNDNDIQAGDFSSDNGYTFVVDDLKKRLSLDCRIVVVDDHHLMMIRPDGRQSLARIAGAGNDVFVWLEGRQFHFRRPEKNAGAFRPGSDTEAAAGNDINSPMPGKILQIQVAAGQSVSRGEALFIVEAMKMENEVKSPRDGVIARIHFKAGDLVSVGEPVIELKPEE